MTTYLGVSQRAEQRKEQELKPQDLKSEATSKPFALLRLFYLLKFKTHLPEKEDPGVLSDFHLFAISSMTPFPGGAKGPRRRPSDIGRYDSLFLFTYLTCFLQQGSVTEDGNVAALRAQGPLREAMK